MQETTLVRGLCNISYYRIIRSRFILKGWTLLIKRSATGYDLTHLPLTIINYFSISCLTFLVLKLDVFQQVSSTKIQVLSSPFWATCPSYYNLIDFNIPTMWYQLPILYIFPVVFEVLHVFKHPVLITKVGLLWDILTCKGYGLYIRKFYLSLALCMVKSVKITSVNK
jgi:hypothetical protein